MAEVTKDALEYLVETGKKLVPVERLEFSGRQYTRQEIKQVRDPLVTALRVSTLRSLIDLCQGTFKPPLVADGVTAAFEGFDAKKHVVHVVNEKQVQVVSALSNVWKDREVLIDCNLTETTDFPLGEFMGQDKFIIALLSCCVPSDDRDALAKIAGNATAEKVTTATDDGISQMIGTRDGAHLEARQDVKNIVTLKLYRTFREVTQPDSRFLFRVKQSGDNIPNFAFFQADGGAWKLEAIENVRRFLCAALTDATVAA